MSFEYKKENFSSEEVEKIEAAKAEETKDELLNRMQEILDQEAPLSESDKVELDHLEIELRELDKSDSEESVDANVSVDSNPLVLKDSDRANPVIGGEKQIDADINDLPASHRPPSATKPRPQDGEYT